MGRGFLAARLVYSGTKHEKGYNMARVCYQTNESYFSRADQGYYIAKITEDEAGYEPFGLCRVLGEAVEKVQELNDELGLTHDDVADIVASSMRLGAMK